MPRTRPKDKGTAAETLVVRHLVASGLWPGAHRSALSGTQDIGDIIGTPGVTIQVKNCQTLSVPAWLRDTETQRGRAGNVYGLLVAKRQGMGGKNVGNWYAIMLNEQWKQLWRSAGKPSIDFVRAGKSVSGALGALGTAVSQVVTVEMKAGVEVAGESSYKIMTLDGALSLWRLGTRAEAYFPDLAGATAAPASARADAPALAAVDVSPREPLIPTQPPALHDWEQCYYTVQEVASSLRVGRRAVYSWIKEGKIVATRTPGRMLRVRGADVAHLFAVDEEVTQMSG